MDFLGCFFGFLIELDGFLRCFFGFLKEFHGFFNFFFKVILGNFMDFSGFSLVF